STDAGSRRPFVRCVGSCVPPIATMSTASTRPHSNTSTRDAARYVSALIAPRPTASSTTRTTVWSAIPPRMFPIAIPRLRDSAALIAEAHETAGRSLGCSPDRITFGANMTSLNFTLTRTAARTFTAGDEILVTGLDHDANVSPWLELAHDLDLVVRIVGLNDDTTLDLDDLERQLS